MSKPIIRAVMRFENDMIMVFDNRGKQITEYQGQYEQIKESILRDAPSDAYFYRCYTRYSEFKAVPREQW